MEERRYPTNGESRTTCPIAVSLAPQHSLPLLPLERFHYACDAPVRSQKSFALAGQDNFSNPRTIVWSICSSSRLHLNLGGRRGGCALCPKEMLANIELSMMQSRMKGRFSRGKAAINSRSAYPGSISIVLNQQQSKSPLKIRPYSWFMAVLGCEVVRL
jgi:hypothetical protein